MKLLTIMNNLLVDNGIDLEIEKSVHPNNNHFSNDLTYRFFILKIKINFLHV